MAAGDAGEARKREYASGEGAEYEGRDAVSAPGMMGRDEGTCQSMCGRVVEIRGGERGTNTHATLWGGFCIFLPPPGARRSNMI